MAEHRVSMLRDALRGRRSPDRARDPRLRAVEEQLMQLRLAPDPDPVFRAELRTQLVAIAPRLVAEGTPVEVETTGKHRAGTARTAPAAAPARHTDARGRRFPIARTLRVATAMVVLAALLLGGAFWMSRDALPGDNLYGLKRAGESVRLSFSGGGQDRATDQLHNSATRANEVLQLWTNGRKNAPTPGVGVNDRTAQLIKDTLDDANKDLKAGASTLNTDAVHDRSSAPLTAIESWGADQGKLLGGISQGMKGFTLRSDVLHSADLLGQAVGRAKALGPDLNRACKGRGSDQWGPTPCTRPSGPAPARPTGGHSGTTGGSGSGKGSHGTGGASGGTRSTAPKHTQPTSSAPARAATPSGNPAAPSSSRQIIPNLPLSSVPAKVSVGKCVSVSAGPIGVGLGKCPSG